MSLTETAPHETTLEAGGHAKGVAVAIVRDNKDTSGLGRVKVSFPWHSQPQESYWARVATPMAGNERGIYFIPEVNDEVLVAFERGDVRFPVRRRLAVERKGPVAGRQQRRQERRPRDSQPRRTTRSASTTDRSRSFRSSSPTASASRSIATASSSTTSRATRSR